MASFRSFLRRQGIRPTVACAWLLGALAFFGEWWLLWPFITTGIVDSRPEVGGSLLLPAFAWFWLGGALRGRARGRRPTGPLSNVSVVLSLAVSESIMAGGIAFLALGPLVLGVVRDQQVQWAAVLTITQYILFGLILFSASVFYAVRASHSQATPHR